jgi:hypothetical protein
LSELLRRIELALASSGDPHHRGELLARKAIYLARVGEFAASKQLALDLRRDFSVEMHPRIVILVILLEGIIDHYENLGQRGQDRITGAQLLSLASGDPNLISQTSAWRAHIEFEKSNFGEMVAAINRVHGEEVKSDQEARARVARVLADCFSLIGDRSQSKKWFEIARKHALDIGDQAMVDALIYNGVAFGLARLRSESCFGVLDKARLPVIATELASARNYQKLIGIKSLTHLVDVCSARFAMLSGDFSRAIELLTAYPVSGPVAKNNFSSDLQILELAYCNLRTGNSVLAEELSEKISDHEYGGLDVDDRLAAAWMELELALKIGSVGVVQSAIRRLDHVKDEYQKAVQSLSNAVEEFRIHDSA